MRDKRDNTHSKRRPNRLIHEKSPYLLQHAYNPVDWYPWGQEALEKAGRENKPIFLSIGYSTCHWCHVMEHESFEDPEVAGLMNQTFVSIKVDREERPDLDHVYMSVCQMMTRSGGWPLTILMTPEKKPFFAATYIPKGNRFGRTGMMALIPRIQEIWKDRHGEVVESAENVLHALRSVEPGSSVGDLETGDLERAYQGLAERFDEVNGGFGEAPRFPSPHNFLFLLRYWKRSGNPQALGMVKKTLQSMRQGGIYDQIGHGFHRYSTDRKWLVPHFEKMLYDQAMLTMAYTEAYQVTENVFYRNTAQEILEYVLRDMTSAEGGFFSAEDADSEGLEGRFYLWQEDEFRKVLQKEEADLMIRVFHVEKNGNFLEEVSRKNTGENILYLGRPIPEIASGLRLSTKELEARIASAGKKLFGARKKRIHPRKDDKILTDWNGLMIAALARAARVLREKRYENAAVNAAYFILKKMRTPDNRLFHRYREGDAGIQANLDDYAFFIWGLLELYEATYEPRYIKTALSLTRVMLKHYWDRKRGGLFFTPDDGESLLLRHKEAYDGAIPSGNGVAMLNLLRLARFTGQVDLEEKASKITRAFSRQIRQVPSAYTQFLVAADFGFGPSYEVVVSGPSDSEDTTEMLKALNRKFLPNHVTIFRPSDRDSSEIDEVAPFVKGHVPMEGKATAYVCSANACTAPTTDIKEMITRISGKTGRLFLDAGKVDIYPGALSQL
jgi:uncharacterized protein YyaL (SSP411 family)